MAAWSSWIEWYFFPQRSTGTSSEPSNQTKPKSSQVRRRPTHCSPANRLEAILNLYSIQTLTSIKAASALNKALPPERTAPLNILIQINTSGEDSKSGLGPLSAEDVANAEVAQLTRHIIKECPRLQLQGLMTISALEQSLADADENADFERLKGT
ncbi:hypothetical protein K438DRAFT_1934427 [Mycena galopus ATCC 62051]|nr:hypothetical protein K438DRAFT_1934427 [Mycena galopus ATCC 62051]